MENKPKHSPFGASIAHRWMRCPVSVKRSQGVPERPPTPAAEEGTMLHGFAEELLRTGKFPRGFFDLDEEQQAVVQTYVNTVELTRLQLGRGAKLYVEHRFQLKCHPMFYGTADAVVISADRKRLTVLDLKCGAGVPVEADYDGKLNPQAGYYLLGARDAFFSEGELAPEMEIVIVQPRAGGVKRRKVDIFELMDLRYELLAAAKLAESENPPAEAGPHCRYCPAAPNCPDLKAYSLKEAQMEFAETPVSPETLSNSALAGALNKARTIEFWLKSVREEAQRRIKSGANVPGWAVAPTRPTRKWKNENEAAKRLADLGVTSIYVEELVSPAQAEKSLKKLDWDFEAQMGDLVEKVSSGERLIHASETPDAKDDFE